MKLNTFKKSIIIAISASTLTAGFAKQAKETPSYSTYKLRDGTVVQMSESQKAIANGKWHKMASEDIARVARAITVFLEVTKQDGTAWTGTGFYWNANTIITNAHMTRDMVKFTIYDSDGTKHENGVVVGKNMPCDLAWIQFPDANSKYTAVNVTDSDWEQQGERVYVFGNPEGMRNTFSEGILSSRRGAVFQIGAGLSHGSSGSPVFNEYGYVIGIIQGGIDNTTAQIAWAICMNTIFDLDGVTDSDHPKGFHTGVSNGFDIRSKEDIAFDNQAANGAGKIASN